MLVNSNESKLTGDGFFAVFGIHLFNVYFHFYFNAGVANVAYFANKFNDGAGRYGLFKINTVGN